MFDIIFNQQININKISTAKFLYKYCGLFIFSRLAKKLYRFELLKYLKDDKYKKIKDLSDTVTQKILDGYCVCVFPASLGDTLLFFEYKKVIEKQHNLKCFCIIRQSQKIIPKLCNETEYTIVDDINLICKLPITQALYFDAETLQDIGNKSSKIAKSQIFIAHTDYIKAKTENMKLPGNAISFREFNEYLYDIPYNSNYEDVLSLDLLNTEANIDKTILLAPESATAATTNKIQSDFWINIARQYKSKGYNVYYNSIKGIKYLDKYATWLNCDLENALKFALKSEKIISIRSGICDLLHSLGKRLFVIYPDTKTLEDYSLNKLFKRNDINEFIYNNENTDYILNNIL